MTSNIKVGYKVEAQFDLGKYQKGHIYIVEDIKPCDALNNNDEICQKCPGYLSTIKNKSADEDDCWGYGEGYLWKLAVVKNWRSRICQSSK